MDIEWITIVDKELIIHWMDRMDLLEAAKKKQERLNNQTHARINEMDEKIRKIEKELEAGKKDKAQKGLKSLEKADKKRDKLVTKGKKAMKGKC